MTEKNLSQRLTKFLHEWWIILVVLFVGFGWLILGRLGPTFNLVIGDLGDARFNNFVLEHFYRWLAGLESDYWTAPFFYPYTNSLAFSDNLLGSAPVYALARWLGLGFYSAYQVWFSVGFITNYLAAAFVLKKFQFTSLAAAFGAFFFAFGLPMLAQQGHAQLIYRFCMPLLCWSVIDFSRNPRLSGLLEISFWFTWQFYLGMYLGFFTILLLVLLLIAVPFTLEKLSFYRGLIYWFAKIGEAWRQDDKKARLFFMIGCVLIFAALLYLLHPYYQISSDFHASRKWKEVAGYLITLRDYFLAENSIIWHSFSVLINQGQSGNEHQSFTGIVVTGLLFTGMFGWRKFLTRNMAGLFFIVLASLFILTFSVNGFTFSRWIFSLPGFNSIRVISRIPLVMMFPLAVVCASILDSISKLQMRNPFPRVLPIVLLLLLVLESGLTNTPTYSMDEAELRVAKVSEQIPANLPVGSVLFIRDPDAKTWLFTSLDSMMLAQRRGWKLFGGYTGWIPPGFGANSTCSQLPKRLQVIAGTFQVDKGKIKQWYENTVSNIVAIGFTDCDPSWWISMPDYKALP